MVDDRYLAEGVAFQVLGLQRLVFENVDGDLFVVGAFSRQQHAHRAHLGAAVEAVEREL
jgi:hypothetical protein